MSAGDASAEIIRQSVSPDTNGRSPRRTNPADVTTAMRRDFKARPETNCRSVNSGVSRFAIEVWLVAGNSVMRTIKCPLSDTFEHVLSSGIVLREQGALGLFIHVTLKIEL